MRFHLALSLVNVLSVINRFMFGHELLIYFIMQSYYFEIYWNLIKKSSFHFLPLKKFFTFVFLGVDENVFIDFNKV